MFAKIAKIDELAKVLSVKSATCEVVSRMISLFSLGRMLPKLSLGKKRGHDLAGLLISLMMFRIVGKTINAMSRVCFYDLFDIDDNAFYRVMNRTDMNWRGLLLSMARRFAAIIHKENAEECSVESCYIIDDTTLAKSGMHFEGLSRVFDHVIHKCVPGFKLLLLAYFDGRSTYALDLSLHREAGKKKDFGLSKKERDAQHKKDREEGTMSRERFDELDSCKWKNAIHMIDRAWTGGIRTKYALADTWFTNSQFVAELRKIGKGGVHLVGRLKMGNEKFGIGRRKYNVHQLITLHEREARRCDKYKCLHFSVRCMMGETSVKLFFVKVGRNKDWNVIITTDMDLKFIKAFELYQVRWNIEVMFRECRQYLGLGSYQSTDFDGQIASCTLCMMTHMVLTLGKRLNEYETMGELFRESRDGLIELTLWKRTLAVLQRLLCVLAESYGIDTDVVMADLLDGHKNTEDLMNLMLMTHAA